MSLAQSLNRKKIPDGEVRAIAEAVVGKIRSVSLPSTLILFGSASQNRFFEGSDIDLLLVYPNLQSLNEGRRAIRKLGLLHPTVPVDLVFLTDETFQRKKDVGGICFVAAHEGVEL